MPVVVAPPFTVRPPACEPLPTVVDAKNKLEPVNVLKSESSVEEAALPVRHVLLIAKQPVLPAAVIKLIPPPWKVEVAVVEA